MRRSMAVLMVVGVITLPLLGTFTVAASGPNNSTSNNSTTTTHIQHLKSKNTHLKSQNTNLKNKIVHKNAKIKKLQSKVNSKKTSFSSNQVKTMKMVGAWNPQTQQPAVFITRNHGFGPVAYEWVGPGNGQSGNGANFNGENAWRRVAKPARSMTVNNVSWKLAYAPAGMNKTYKSSTLAQYKSQLSHVRRKLNTPGGVIWSITYVNSQYHTSKSRNTRYMGFVLVLLILVFIGGSIFEHRKHIVERFFLKRSDVWGRSIKERFNR